MESENWAEWKSQGGWSRHFRQCVRNIKVNTSSILAVQGLLTRSTSNWKLPDIQGLADFKGKLVHTANW
jgi:cation diffusion facilitator CzcD-associated flavoprotein CzcO